MGKVVKRYTEQDIASCLSEIKNRVPMKTACRKYNVPRSTIKFRLSGKWTGKTRKGAPTVLSSEEETEIVSWITRMARKGFPLTKERLVTTVQSFIAANPRQRPMNAGRKWYDGFLRRHPEISVRKPEKVSTAAATVDPDDIRRWHRSVYEILEEEGYAEILKDPSRLLNGDEFGLVLDPDTKAVLVPRGSKNTFLIDTGSKKSITVLNAYTAAGLAIPPCVILPYQRIPEKVSKGFPAEWGVGKTESGWMTKEAFLVKENVQFPVIFFVDGHKSHTPFETAQECIKLGIILVFLYANCMHIIQPADVSIYRGLKAGWTKQVRIWQAKNPGKSVQLEDFGELLQKAIECSFKPEFVINGFRACGLFPFDVTAIDFSKCIAGKKSMPTTDNLVTRPTSISDTVPVSRELLNGFIEWINPNQAALYRAVEPDFFEDGSERIVCALYKNVLQNLDEREFHDLLDDDEEEFYNRIDGGLSDDGEKLNDGVVLIDNEEDLIADGADEFVMGEEFLDDNNGSIDFANEDDTLPDTGDNDDPRVDVQDSSLDDAGGDVQCPVMNEWNHQPEAYHDDFQQDVNRTPQVDLQESCDSTDIENIENKDRAQDDSISSFFSEPNTPKKKNNRKYKKPKSPPVLTSRRRIELHQKIAQEKAEKQQQKEQKRVDKAKIAEEKKRDMIDKASKRLERLNKELREMNSQRIV